MNAGIDTFSAGSQRIRMNSHRKTSLVAGLLYILTFISIPTLGLYRPLHQPGYLIRPGTDDAVILGGILEIIVALAGIATAVVLYPVLKKQNQTLALGLVTSRVLEASTIFVGVAFILTAVTLHQNRSGLDGVATSRALVSLYDRIFLLGQSFMPAVNDVLLGVLLYKSRLVPRALSLIGIVGSAPLIAGYLAVMFGLIEQRSTLAGLAAVMVALFEFLLGVYLIIKGFKQSPAIIQSNH